MTRPTITLGLRLQLARKAAGISPARMAELTGYAKESISRFENGKAPVPTSVLYIYQHECGVTREYIEGRAELTQEVLMSRCLWQRPLWEHYAA